MKYSELGKTGIKVSRIGFGVLTVGGSQLNLPVAEGAAVLRYAFEKGISFLDTAQYYQTYPYIRKALKGGRFEPVIASKCLDYTYRDMEFAIEEARKELDRDIIDIFLMHEVRNDPDLELRAGAWECLNDYKAKGIVKAIGVSTHHTDVAHKVIDIPECDILFPLINYQSLGIRCGDGPGTRESMAEAIRLCSEKGKGVFAMKVFGGGNLTGTYQQALDYVKNLPGIDSMMIGFGKTHEIDQICDYIDGVMKPDFQPDVSKKKIRIDQGDCEGCGACIERCPNHAIFRNSDGLAEVNHSICLTCGYCAPKCPVRAIIMF